MTLYETGYFSVLEKLGAASPSKIIQLFARKGVGYPKIDWITALSKIDRAASKYPRAAARAKIYSEKGVELGWGGREALEQALRKSRSLPNRLKHLIPGLGA